MNFLEAEAEKGNDLAREYLRKYNNEDGNISLEWACRAVKENINDTTIRSVFLKAKKQGFNA
jgi:hypothetical protein